MRETK
ncbi:hypothetical protein OIU77_011596 [Salix suchowensis]|jgi:hypothetical protein